MLALQDAERRRPRGDEASADHLRARSRQPAALPQMRQGGPTPRGDSATIGLAASPPSNRSLTDVQSLFDHHQPGRHQRAVSRRQPVRRQPGADARRVSGLQGADRAQRRRGPRARHRALGHAVVVKGADGCHQEARRKAAGQGQAGRLQGIAPDGAGRRHDQHPQREEQALDAMAGIREPLRGAVQLASASSTRPRAATSGSRSTRPVPSPASPASGPTGRRSGRSRKARRPTTSTRS